MIVVRMTSSGHLETLADAQAPLRLVREVGARRHLGAAAIDRTLAVLRDFQAVACSAGAQRAIAVATSAVREATNGLDLVGRARREIGLTVQVIDGQREARAAFLGAVASLPVEHGVVFDLGGGSLEISHFRHRRLRRAWTLPLGALRMSDRFLAHDPPREGEIRALRKIVRAALRKADVPTLREDEDLIGTGGTIRNLAKIDRRRRDYPIPRLHGYALDLHRVQEVAALLALRRREKRAAIPGLNADRVDSIVGGAIIVQTAMKALAADQMLVAGQGLREGLAIGALGRELGAPKAVRHGSIVALCARFNTWTARTGSRRAGIAAGLMAALDPKAPPEVREFLGYAALALDIGQSMDHFRRYEHAAAILRASDLSGFSHRDIALLSALLRQAGDTAPAWELYRPLLREDDQPVLARGGVILALADQMAARWPPDAPATVRCERRGGEVVLSAPALAVWDPRRLAIRFERAFGRRLVIEGGSASSPARPRPSRRVHRRRSRA
jgi:exopolyphosphatase/guanosine-5'-triphosphate,3'-diphosphate pyrophosphatase